MTIRREQLANNVETQLSALINNSVTSVSVSDGSVFPSDGDFRIIIDDEIMLVTARSTNALTVVRAQEGTTGAMHAANAKVRHILTAESLKIYARESGIPAFGLAPPLYRLANASAVVLAQGDWTEQDVDSKVATSNETDTSIKYEMVASGGESLRMFRRAAPTAPYTVVAAFHGYLQGENTAGSDALVGVGFRQAANSDVLYIGYKWDGQTVGGTAFSQSQIVVEHWTDSTTVGTVHLSQPITIPSLMWFKVEDDDTDLKFYISHNGFTWNEMFSRTRTTEFSGGPDQVVLVMKNEVAEKQFIHLLHYEEA